MSMLGPSELSGANDSRGASRVGQVILVVLLMLIVGVAAYFVGSYFGNRAVPNTALPIGTNSTAGNSTVSAVPCVTTTTVPGKALPKPSSVALNVYNATERAGLARKTADTMKSRGFKVGKVANDPLSKTVTATAEIRYGGTGLAAAQLVRFYVPGAVLVKDARKDASVDLVVGAAFKGVAEQSAVDAALAKPVVVPGPGCPDAAKPSAVPAPSSAAPTATAGSPAAA